MMARKTIENNNGGSLRQKNKYHPKPDSCQLHIFLLSFWAASRNHLAARARVTFLRTKKYLPNLFLFNGEVRNVKYFNYSTIYFHINNNLQSVNLI